MAEHPFVGAIPVSTMPIEDVVVPDGRVLNYATT
jgi:hypothetical protein